jgi:hypothetical protein
MTTTTTTSMTKIKINHPNKILLRVRRVGTNDATVTQIVVVCCTSLLLLSSCLNHYSTTTHAFSMTPVQQQQLLLPVQVQVQVQHQTNQQQQQHHQHQQSFWSTTSTRLYSTTETTTTAQPKSSKSTTSTSSLKNKKSSNKKKATLGLLTFDLDDTIYPLAPVIEEANAAFAKAMERYGFPNIQSNDITKRSVQIRNEIAASDPERAATLSHTEIRKLAIRKEMEFVMVHRKLKECAVDWATNVESLGPAVVASARKYVCLF